MAKVCVRRHGPSDYPRDGLSAAGIDLVRQLAESLPRYSAVIVSEAERAKQTALHLGLGNVRVDPRANELEYPKNFPTAAQYTEFVFSYHLGEVLERAGAFLDMIGETNQGEILVISHRVLMVAAYAYLTRGWLTPELWNSIDFDPLDGFELEIAEGGLHLVRILK